MIRKKVGADHLENKVNASLLQILSYRLREGFTIKHVHFKANLMEVSLVLPWRHNVNIEYNISTFYPEAATLTEDDDGKVVKYEVYVESNYNFLHDATCFARKSFKSSYRSTTIKQFWNTLQGFSDSDKLGIHFHNFAINEAYRSIPATIQSGVPLFYMPPNLNTPVIHVPMDAHIKFSQYWKPICMLDAHMFQKSALHTHQINLLLKHDNPLPDNLYHSNLSGRYSSIQCQQALQKLNDMLKDYTSFVLLENHSYIKLIDEKNKTCSFFLIRILSQLPCIVLHLAFIGGTNCLLRNEIVNELMNHLVQCKLPQRNLSSSLMQKTNDQPDQVNVQLDQDMFGDKGNTSDDSSSNPVPHLNDNNSERSDLSIKNKTGCFVVLTRPIEKLLIRYENIPRDFFSIYKFEQDLKNSNSQNTLNMFQTLTRFLHHKRFVWTTHDCLLLKPLTAIHISKILSTLTLKRIQEGFHLAYNNWGVVNLATELTFKDELGTSFPCLVQYIIFPSNIVSNKNRYCSIRYQQLRNIHFRFPCSMDDYEDESFIEKNSDYLIVTECWVEPQSGVAVLDESMDNKHNRFLQDLNYDQISTSVRVSRHLI